MVRRRAEYELIECMSPVDTHDNQIRLALGRLVKYLAIRSTFDDSGLDRAVLPVL